MTLGRSAQEDVTRHLDCIANSRLLNIIINVCAFDVWKKKWKRPRLQEVHTLPTLIEKHCKAGMVHSQGFSI